MDTKLDKEIVREIKVFTNFKIHLGIYIIVVALIWLSYWAAGGFINMEAWPVYLSLAWGFGLMIHCLLAYRAFRKKKNDI